MKYQLLRIICLSIVFFTKYSQAQVRVAPVTNNDLRTNLSKVLTDFSNDFSNIRGEVLVDNPQTIEYATLLEFESAESNSIFQYPSKKPIYSWQAVMLTTDDFEEAKKKYTWLYNQLKVMTVNLDNGYSFTLSGSYDEPKESQKFSGSIFTLTPAATNLPRVKIEVTLQYYFPEWKVGLTVYEKERRDDERGNIEE